MTSAVVFWNYQRRLSESGRRGSQNEAQRTNVVDVKTQRSRRLESESSVTGYNNEEHEERRNSAVAVDSDDEEAEAPVEKPKGRRRFSLDFLFSRRKSKDKSDKKLKSKRSKSNTETADDYVENNDNYRAYRYPGFGGAEFALAM